MLAQHVALPSTLSNQETFETPPRTNVSERLPRASEQGTHAGLGNPLSRKTIEEHETNIEVMISTEPVSEGMCEAASETKTEEYDLSIVVDGVFQGFRVFA